MRGGRRRDTSGRRAVRRGSQPLPGSFGAAVARASSSGQLVVQPRMGYADPEHMRAGLLATKRAATATAGTITLDSYTRVGDHAAARRALASGADLNGYPIVAHPPRRTRALLDGIVDDAFPVQVRHGSARPRAIVRAMARAGLDATEGGPVSYCLPYGRVPLAESVRNWVEGCRLLARAARVGRTPHLETFGGCMLGQLCPPGLLVALSLLEALFFRQHGLTSVSLSYAQQTDMAQDLEALAALRTLAGEFLDGMEWHVVVYTYMGLYPRTAGGVRALLQESARLARRGSAQRLVVKTAAEAFRIPTIAENVEALEQAAGAAFDAGGPAAHGDSEVLAQARALVETVLDLDGDIGRALRQAFERGLVDVPYCLHPDNAGRATSYIDGDGRLAWASPGAMPIPASEACAGARRPGPDDLLSWLSYVRRTFDARAASVGPAAVGHVAR